MSHDAKHGTLLLGREELIVETVNHSRNGPRQTGMMTPRPRKRDVNTLLRQYVSIRTL